MLFEKVSVPATPGVTSAFARVMVAVVAAPLMFAQSAEAGGGDAAARAIATETADDSLLLLALSVTVHFHELL